MNLVPDCNDCIWINLTEEEQRRLCVTQIHLCQNYHVRILHRTQYINHMSYLHPCKECEKDRYQMFTDKNDKSI